MFMLDVSVVEYNMFQYEQGFSSNRENRVLRKHHRESYKKATKAIFLAALVCTVAGVSYVAIAGVPVLQDLGHMLPGSLSAMGSSNGVFLWYYFSHGFTFPNFGAWFDWLTVSLGLSYPIAKIIASALVAAGWIDEATAAGILTATGYVGIVAAAAIAAF